MVRRERNQLLYPAIQEKIKPDEQRPGLRLNQALEGGVYFAIGGSFQLLNPYPDGRGAASTSLVTNPSTIELFGFPRTPIVGVLGTSRCNSATVFAPNSALN
jgi:hypothetical protein